MTTMFRTDPVTATEPHPSLGIALSVIVPVFDQADLIAANVESIRDRVAAGHDVTRSRSSWCLMVPWTGPPSA